MGKQVKRVKCPRPELSDYWQDKIKELPPSLLGFSSSVDVRPMTAWCSNKLMVMYYPSPDGTARLTIRLHEHKQAVLDWDSLQDIKTACGFAEYQAFEVYPTKSDIVNACNLRHLWLMPKSVKLDLGWVRQREGYTLIEPLTVARELDTALEQLDVFIKGGQWTVIAEHGYPKKDGKRYIVVFHFNSDTRHHLILTRFHSVTGFSLPKGAIATHYYSVLEMPHGLLFG